MNLIDEINKLKIYINEKASHSNKYVKNSIDIIHLIITNNNDNDIKLKAENDKLKAENDKLNLMKNTQILDIDKNTSLHEKENDNLCLLNYNNINKFNLNYNKNIQKYRIITSYTEVLKIFDNVYDLLVLRKNYSYSKLFILLSYLF